GVRTVNYQRTGRPGRLRCWAAAGPTAVCLLADGHPAELGACGDPGATGARVAGPQLGSRLMSQPTIRLGDVAGARSGHKGNHANIGVVAHSPEDYEHLARHLTADRVAEFFRGLGASRVERFELPKLWAMNFVLYDCLAGGASRSLRIDTQGKLLGTAILDLP